MASVRALDSSPITSKARNSYTLDASDATEGTLLIAMITCRETETVTQAPIGWDLRENIGSGVAIGNSDDARTLFYTKIASASESSYVWMVGNGYGSAGLIEVDGVEPSVMIYEIEHEDDLVNPVTIPQVSVDFSNSVAIVLAGAVDSDATQPFLPPVNYSQIIDTGTSRRAALAIAWREYASVGQTDPAAEYAQADGNEVSWAIAHIVLAPAGSIVITPPLTPTGIVVSSNETSLMIEWAGNTESNLHTAEPYEYRISMASDMSNASPPMATDNTEALIADLTPGTTYWVQLRAKNDSDMVSEWSTAISATTVFGSSNSGIWGMDIGLS